MLIGYKRVSTQGQKLDRQTDILNEYGVERIFEEKVTGTKRNRQELDKMLDTTTPQGKLLFTIFAGLSQFERDLIADRTKDGLVSARNRGAKLGRPNKFQDKQDVILEMYNSNDYSINDIITATGISKTSLYRLVNAIR